MAYSHIKQAIRDQVNTDLGGTYSIQYDNQGDFEKPNDTVYLRAFIRFSPTSVPISFGDGVEYELVGTLEFQVIGPAGVDETDVDEAVDDIIAAFAYPTVLDVGDAENSKVRFQNPSPFPVGIPDGTYQTNVPINFWTRLVASN
jgi:hypothetical protein